MAPFRLQAIARRHATQFAARPLPHARHVLPRQDAGIDPRGGQLVRGLMVGLPIGLCLWLFLALLIWKFA